MDITYSIEPNEIWILKDILICYDEIATTEDLPFKNLELYKKNRPEKIMDLSCINMLVWSPLHLRLAICDYPIQIPLRLSDESTPLITLDILSSLNTTLIFRNVSRKFHLMGIYLTGNVSELKIEEFIPSSIIQKSDK